VLSALPKRVIVRKSTYVVRTCCAVAFTLFTVFVLQPDSCLLLAAYAALGGINFFVTPFIITFIFLSVSVTAIRSGLNNCLHRG
jgi:hypothetical protein